jgi:hypothetical protein
MLGAVDLLVALGRDDLPISPENVDQPILTYCKKPCASALYAIELPILMTESISHKVHGAHKDQDPVIGEILKKSRPFIIGQDFLQNVTVKLLSLCELSVLCERPPHIPSLMHNLGPLPMRERLTALSALGGSGFSCDSQSPRGRHGGRPSQQISPANRLTAKKPPRQTEALETLAIRDREAVA